MVPFSFYLPFNSYVGYKKWSRSLVDPTRSAAFLLDWQIFSLFQQRVSKVKSASVMELTAKYLDSINWLFDPDRITLLYVRIQFGNIHKSFDKFCHFDILRINVNYKRQCRYAIPLLKFNIHWCGTFSRVFETDVII